MLNSMDLIINFGRK